MATYNGEKYLREQINSILPQLSDNDELVISDDGSTDSTIDIILSYQDNRIKLLHNSERHGFVGNFEFALKHAAGDIIFLSDQDDVWINNKLRIMEQFILDNNLDIAMNNCILTDSDLNILTPRFYNLHRNPETYGFWRNIYSNTWLGCCMCFKKHVLNKCLPFPNKLIAHDIWIGLLGNYQMRVGYYDTPLQFYRRHELTASYAGKKSRLSIKRKIAYRLYILIHILFS